MQKTLLFNKLHHFILHFPSYEWKNFGNNFISLIHTQSYLSFYTLDVISCYRNCLYRISIEEISLISTKLHYLSKCIVTAFYSINNLWLIIHPIFLIWNNFFAFEDVIYLLEAPISILSILVIKFPPSDAKNINDNLVKMKKSVC